MGCGAKYRAHVLHTPHPHFAQVPSALWHQPDMARYLWQGVPLLKEEPRPKGGNLRRVTCLLQLTWACVPYGRCFRGEAGAKVKLGCLLSPIQSHLIFPPQSPSPNPSEGDQGLRAVWADSKPSLPTIFLLPWIGPL